MGQWLPGSQTLLILSNIVMKHSSVILMSMLMIIPQNISYTLPRTVYTELEDTDYPGPEPIYYPIFVNQESSLLDSLPLPPSPPKNRREGERSSSQQGKAR